MGYDKKIMKQAKQASLLYCCVNFDGKKIFIGLIGVHLPQFCSTVVKNNPNVNIR